jgi:hypothetical protein
LTRILFVTARQPTASHARRDCAVCAPVTRTGQERPRGNANTLCQLSVSLIASPGDTLIRARLAGFDFLSANLVVNLI